MEYGKVLEKICFQHNVPTPLREVLEQFCDPYNTVEKKKAVHLQIKEGYWGWMKTHPILRETFFEDYMPQDYPNFLDDDDSRLWCIVEAINKQHLWDSQQSTTENWYEYSTNISWIRDCF